MSEPSLPSSSTSEISSSLPSTLISLPLLLYGSLVKLDFVLLWRINGVSHFIKEYSSSSFCGPVTSASPEPEAETFFTLLRLRLTLFFNISNFFCAVPV